MKAQLNTAMDEALFLHALAHAHLDQQVCGALLEHAGADAMLYVFAAAVFEYNRFDSLQMQELREHKPSRPGADDSDLRSHEGSPVSWRYVRSCTETIADVVER